MDSLDRIEARRLAGNEPLHRSFNPVGVTVADFWSWSGSDLISNTLRGVLAEFIVAKALGVATGVRAEWDDVDLRMTDGIKVEVKSAAYLQSWKQDKHSKIKFDVAPSKGWDAETNVRDESVLRRADVYVFCLLNHKDKETVDPLDMDQWRFFVLATDTLNSRIGEQASVALAPLLKLSPVEARYGEIAAAVASVLSAR